MLFNAFFNFIRPVRKVATYKYISNKDVVDKSGRVYREQFVEERKVNEPFTPQTGLETKINNIGWMTHNHQQVVGGQGEKTMVVHHGNPYLDCNVPLTLSKNLEFLSEKLKRERFEKQKVVESKSE